MRLTVKSGSTAIEIVLKTRRDYNHLTTLMKLLKSAMETMELQYAEETKN